MSATLNLQLLDYRFIPIVTINRVAVFVSAYDICPVGF